jgi:hypothetical protein
VREVRKRTQQTLGSKIHEVRTSDSQQVKRAVARHQGIPHRVCEIVRRRQSFLKYKVKAFLNPPVTGVYCIVEYLAEYFLRIHAAALARHVSEYISVEVKLTEAVESIRPSVVDTVSFLAGTAWPIGFNPASGTIAGLWRIFIAAARECENSDRNYQQQYYYFLHKISLRYVYLC